MALVENNQTNQVSALMNDTKNSEGENLKLSIVGKDPNQEDEQPEKRKLVDSPYFQVVIYAIACLTTSAIYFGWQPYQEMLFRGGAYAWNCDPSWDFDLDGPCWEQERAVTLLYSFAQGSEFVCAFLAGLLLDHVGPRWTAVIGEALFGIAILLMATSAQGFQMYIPAMIISGGCVNIVAFPSLVVTERWPTRQALAVSIIVGAQSGASVVAPILKYIWDQNLQYTYFGVWGVYLLAIWLPVSLIYVWALPARRDYTKLSKQEPEVAPATSESALALQDAPADDVKPKIPQTSKEKWTAFGRDLKTIDFIICAIFNVLLMLQFAYYPSVVRSAVGNDISEFVGWMTPLQAPSSVVIGFAMDYTGTCLIMYAMCAVLLFVSLSAGLGPTNMGLMRTTAILFVFMQSASYNVKYTYVNEMYDPYNFGKLVGFLGIMGGVGVYINMPIATQTAYREIFMAYVSVSCFMAALTFFLHWRQMKGISYKTLEGIQQANQKPRSAVKDTIKGANAEEAV